MKTFMIILLGAIVSVSALANEACDEKLANESFPAVVKVNTVSELQIFYSKFKRCISRADLGEGYSEAVSRVLANHWSQVVHSKKLKDGRLVQAIKLGVSETWELNTSKKIIQFAKTRCTELAKPICDEILILEKNPK